MARANNGGWDFIKVGGKYQYKEDSFIAEIEILEDNSNDVGYDFKVKVLNANEPQGKSSVFDRFSHIKELVGYWFGMIQVFESPEYSYKKQEWE
jgi:hypothetical protein